MQKCMYIVFTLCTYRGMQHESFAAIPTYLENLVKQTRQRLHAPDFLQRHRSRPCDFTRRSPLSFPVVGLLVLQKTTKSVQRHLHAFFDQLSVMHPVEAVTPGGWTQARAKLRHTAFIELNQTVVLPLAYAPDQASLLRRWHGHRLVGFDGSLLRLPNTPDMRKAFALVEVTNQTGPTGTAFAQARLSVAYDLLNRLALDARLESSCVGEVDMALAQLPVLQPSDVVLVDRGYTGYRFLASILQGGVHFIARCSCGSFAAAQELFRLDQSGQSRIVTLEAPSEIRAELKRLGLPPTLLVRFVSVRLCTGELEVLVTSLLDENAYPTQEFLQVYHERWGQETIYLMLKSRLDLENWSGRTVQSVLQDLHATVFLCNLESLLTRPAQAHLDAGNAQRKHPAQVNRAVAYHALKSQILELLYSDQPAGQVVRRLQKLFLGAPVPRRPDRKVPRRPPSPDRSYHYQRRVRKTVF
jgi:hypothetical protein